MSLPGWVRRHRITVEAHVAEGAYGATFAPPVELRVWFDAEQGEARGADGSTVTTSGSVLADPNDAEHLNVGARVTWRGRVFHVITVAHLDTGGLVPLDHLEATVG